MLVENKSKRMYVHSVLNARRQAEMLILNPGEHKEIPDEVAKQWLKTGEVIKYADPNEVEKLKAELEALKAEAKEKPAEEAEKAEPANDECEPKAEEKSLDELKAEADKLGISYAKNIGAAKLQEKINKFKEEK